MINNDTQTINAMKNVIEVMLDTQREAVASLIDGLKNNEIDIKKSIGNIMILIGQTTNEIKKYL